MIEKFLIAARVKAAVAAEKVRLMMTDENGDPTSMSNAMWVVLVVLVVLAAIALFTGMFKSGGAIHTWFNKTLGNIFSATGETLPA